MKRILKKLLLGEGRKACRVPFGLFRGLTLVLDPAVESNIYLGLYERETYSWLRRAGRAAGSLVDVGAGVGELTMWGLAHDNIRRVIAYDPGPQRWVLLRDNLRVNGRESDPRLTLVEDYFLGETRFEEDERILDGLQEPILLKLDVDGGEEAILKLLRPTLQSKRFLVLIETHSRALDEACEGILAGAGYEVRRIPQAWWRRFYPENRSLEWNQWMVASKR
jgi:hypothetical protein